jgi:hypothetical protein
MKSALEEFKLFVEECKEISSYLAKKYNTDDLGKELFGDDKEKQAETQKEADA